MTRKQRRAVLIGSGVGILSVAVILVLFALQDSVVFFRSPTDVAEGKVAGERRFRLGGLVEDGTVKRGEGTEIEFVVTDTLHRVSVRHDGILPDLFREGQGIVAEGQLSPDGVFVADTVLAKHDENYMPPEVADALKKRGVKLGQGATHPDAGATAGQATP
jgi:cytochrome c-type biogenesis protein CcmE